MTTLDDLLAVNPTANNAVVACLATTRNNEQCGVSASINAIIRDNNNNNNNRQQTEKGKEKRKERDKVTATWKKIQRNVQRGRKVVVADADLEYLARLFLCTRHLRRGQSPNLVQRIKDGIDTHHQRLTAAKAVTRRQQMNFDFSEGLAWARPSRRRARRLEAERNARREENESARQSSSDQNAGAARPPQAQLVEAEVDTPPQLPLAATLLNTFYNSQLPQPVSPVRPWSSSHFRQPPQPASPVRVGSTLFQQPSQQPFKRRRRAVARKPIETGDECSICLEELAGDGELVWCRTQCGNNFHRPCISNWLDRQESSATCPACRVLWMPEEWPALR